MLFDLDTEDEPTMVLVREDSVAEDLVAETSAEPPALPFPLMRKKQDTQPEEAVEFELAAPRPRVRARASA